MHIDPSWWLGAAGAITAVAAAIGALAKGGRWVYRTWRKLAYFLDEWNGEPARPGHPRVPSVPERLTSVERDLAMVRLQVSPNGGASLLDKVETIKQTVVEGT